MKKTYKHIILAIVIVAGLSTFVSCSKSDELPPRHSGYASSIIIPEASFLTDEDRAVINAMQDEYDLNTK